MNRLAVGGGASSQLVVPTKQEEYEEYISAVNTVVVEIVEIRYHDLGCSAYIS